MDEGRTGFLFDRPTSPLFPGDRRSPGRVRGAARIAGDAPRGDGQGLRLADSAAAYAALYPGRRGPVAETRRPPPIAPRPRRNGLLRAPPADESAGLARRTRRAAGLAAAAATR